MFCEESLGKIKLRAFQKRVLLSAPFFSLHQKVSRQKIARSCISPNPLWTLLPRSLFFSQSHVKDCQRLTDKEILRYEFETTPLVGLQNPFYLYGIYIRDRDPIFNAEQSQLLKKKSGCIAR